MAHDPVRLELVKNAIGSVVDEMVLTVVRIAYSSIMKDTMDLSSAFCDRDGRMIAQGLSLPLHLGSIPDAMDGMLRRVSRQARARRHRDPERSVSGRHASAGHLHVQAGVRRRSPARLRRGRRASQRHGRARAGLERRRLDRDLPGRAAHPAAEALRARRAERDAVQDDRAQRAHSRRRARRPAGAGRGVPHRRARHERAGGRLRRRRARALFRRAARLQRARSAAHHRARFPTAATATPIISTTTASPQASRSR